MMVPFWNKLPEIVFSVRSLVAFQAKFTCIFLSNCYQINKNLDTYNFETKISSLNLESFIF